MDNESDGCFICGETTESRLEEHHIIPRGLDGPDKEKNLVTLCAGCHNAVEDIYDQEFFDRLGAYDETSRIALPSLREAIADWRKEVAEEINEEYDNYPYSDDLDEQLRISGRGEELGVMLGRYHMLKEIDDNLSELMLRDTGQEPGL